LVEDSNDSSARDRGVVKFDHHVGYHF
jgi:hypothetical protein